MLWFLCVCVLWFFSSQCLTWVYLPRGISDSFQYLLVYLLWKKSVLQKTAWRYLCASGKPAPLTPFSNLLVNSHPLQALQTIHPASLLGSMLLLPLVSWLWDLAPLCPVVLGRRSWICRQHQFCVLSCMVHVFSWWAHLIALLKVSCSGH